MYTYNGAHIFTDIIEVTYIGYTQVRILHLHHFYKDHLQCESVDERFILSGDLYPGDPLKTTWTTSRVKYSIFDVTPFTTKQSNKMLNHAAKNDHIGSKAYF